MDNTNTVPDFRNTQDPNNITDLAFQTVEVPRTEEIQELERSQETISVVQDSPVITNSFDPNIDPYIDIVKVPLTTEHGGESRAHSIRIPEWNDREIGVVGEGENTILELCHILSETSSLSFVHLKEVNGLVVKARHQESFLIIVNRRNGFGHYAAKYGVGEIKDLLA